MFQRVTLIGRVGQDPQMRYMPDGTPVTHFSLAITEVIAKTGRLSPGRGGGTCQPHEA